MRTYAGDPDQVATILPGRAYSPAAPLLHFCTMLLLDRGWTVRQVWWDDSDPTPEAATEQACRELDAVSARRHLVVAKSLGTVAALPHAVERGLPGVWLTPLLTEPRVADAVRATSAPTLLVGGTADALWDSEVAARSGAQVLELAGADHSLELGTAVGPSLDLLKQVLERVDAFVGRLDR